MGAKRSARKSRHHGNVVQFQQFLPNKQKDVKIIPRNKNQEDYMLKLLDLKKDIVFGVGPAGTGKTLIAVQVAIKLFKEKVVDKIIVTRPVVSVDEDLGFLPGSLEEKMAPWTRPIFDVLREYFTSKEISGMIEEGIIEISPLAYMRGRTFKRAFILADEMQNATDNQMKMLLTRIGTGSKLVVTGDLAQHERGYESNGLKCFIERLAKTNSDRIKMVQFENTDIERHPVVTEVLKLYNEV